MKAHTKNQRDVTDRVAEAVTIFTELHAALRAKWSKTVSRIASEKLAKAWLPWEKRYWEKRLALSPEEAIKAGGTYYNSPRYLDWSARKVREAEKLKRKYSFARGKLASENIVLENDEIELLSEDVMLAKQEMERI